MRVVRVAIRGFGALANVELAWPEDRLLLVVDPNETGKTTLCEAIVTALFGLPRGRVASSRARERRRPRGGARLALSIEVEAGGRGLTADRDLERGTLRVTDRDRGDVTAEFARGAGRDVFGETVTGLTEPLFRTTAYVAQNVLDADELSKGLTLELARIADSGGGEASVVRALDALEEAAARMPDALSGPTVSVATEIVRLGKRVDEKKAELARRREVRESLRAAAADLVAKANDLAARARRAALLELATVETERRQLAARLEELAAAQATRKELSGEAERLARETAGFTPELLAEIEAKAKARGARPAALARARQEADEAERKDASDGEAARQELGTVSAFPPEERRRLEGLLAELEAARAEERDSEAGVAVAWKELEAEGIADDLRRIDEVPEGDREFLASCDEERHALEMEGVRCDRRAAEAQTAAALAVGERRGLVKRGRGLLIVGAFVLLVALGFLTRDIPRVAKIVLLAAGAGLAAAGGAVWVRGAGHLQGEERRRREEEAAARRQAADVRKKLSELRTRLDRVARAAGFGEGTALARALRRLRAAEAKRAALVSRTARGEAARERLSRLADSLAPFQEVLGGTPGPDALRELRQRLERGEKAFRELEVRQRAREAERERLAREETELSALEEELVALLGRAGVPRLLPLPEALRLAEGAREKQARRREILEVELPARALPPEKERRALAEREARLREERDRRLEALGATPAALETFGTPEEARRAAEAARREVSSAEEARRRAEKTVVARLKEGGERAREAEEELHDLSEGLERAVHYRDALAAAREGLKRAAADAYADFRAGLASASREILATWDVPYEALEFDDRLAVSAVLRGGRRASTEEITTAFSTGAREQIHLTARLAALRYLGTGARGVPLLLDDPLVAADDERFVSVMRFLLRNVLAERPVLVASCHAWRHEQLLARLEPEERDRLMRVSLRSGSVDGSQGPV